MTNLFVPIMNEFWISLAVFLVMSVITVVLILRENDTSVFTFVIGFFTLIFTILSFVGPTYRNLDALEYRIKYGTENSIVNDEKQVQINADGTLMIRGKEVDKVDVSYTRNIYKRHMITIRKSSNDTYDIDQVNDLITGVPEQPLVEPDQTVEFDTEMK